MKKSLKFYSIVWTAMLVLFIFVTFLPFYNTEYDRYTPSFWVGFTCILLSYIGQLICSYFSLKDENATKIFYNISLITSSYIGLTVTFIGGILCMLIPILPLWLAVIICLCTLIFNIIVLTKTTAAIDIVSGIDDKVRSKTIFIKALTVDAESLMSRAKSEAVKAECKKVYEAVRYSDPMSNDALASIEGAISIKFSKLSDAVVSEDSEAVVTLTDEIIILIGDRNKKCKLLK